MGSRSRACPATSPTPAGPRPFALTSAHPPFIAAIGPKRMIFRDADEFGESIARRIVEGLPTRLRAGGTGIVVFAGWDAAKPLEWRAREWIRGAPRAPPLWSGAE